MTIETMAISDNQNNVLIKMRILKSGINFHIDIKKLYLKTRNIIWLFSDMFHSL